MWSGMTREKYREFSRTWRLKYRSGETEHRIWEVGLNNPRALAANWLWRAGLWRRNGDREAWRRNMNACRMARDVPPLRKDLTPKPPEPKFLLSEHPIP